MANMSQIFEDDALWFDGFVTLKGVGTN